MNRRSNSGDKPALIALIGISIVFAFIIGRGWKTLFSPYGAPTAWVAAILIVFIALSLCWAIASERVHHPHAKGVILAYFFFLVNLSALGTINTMFLQFQGSSVVRSEIDKAIVATTKLKSEGAALIDTKEYDEYDRRLALLTSDLRREIQNPVNCGQGPRASQIIEQIKQMVPGFQPLSLGNNCQNFNDKDKVDQVIETYRKKIDEGKRLSQVYVSKKSDIIAKENIEAGASDILSRLTKIPKEINSDSDLYAARSEFEAVAQTYLGLRQEVSSRAKGRDKDIPQFLDISSITSLGNIGQVIPFVISRLNDIATYIYVFLAIVLDFAVIAAFVRVIKPVGRNLGPHRTPGML